MTTPQTPAGSRADVERMQQRLSRKHPAHHICTVETRLVVEGYPRSGNSLLTNMLFESSSFNARWDAVAHHTHHLDNLRIASTFGIPKLILVREPLAAIRSYHIYSGLPLDDCAEDYRHFYAGVLDLMERTAIVHFEDVLGDFRKVVAALNALGDFGLSPGEEYAPLRTRAERVIRERAAKRAAKMGAVSRHVAAPDPERDRLKAELSDTVAKHLRGKPEVFAIYDQVMGLRSGC